MMGAASDKAPSGARGGGRQSRSDNSEALPNVFRRVPSFVPEHMELDP